MSELMYSWASCLVMSLISSFSGVAITFPSSQCFALSIAAAKSSETDACTDIAYSGYNSLIKS